MLLLAQSRQPQCPGTTQAATDNAVHLHRAEAGPALYDAWDPWRRQPAAELPAGVYQHRRLWVKRAGGSRGAKVLWFQLSSVPLAPPRLSESFASRGTPLAGGNRGAQRQRAPGRSCRAVGYQERLCPYSRESRDRRVPRRCRSPQRIGHARVVTRSLMRSWGCLTTTLSKAFSG